MSEIETIYNNVINAVDKNNIPIIGIDGLGGAGKSRVSCSMGIRKEKFIQINSSCKEWNWRKQCI